MENITINGNVTVNISTSGASTTAAIPITKESFNITENTTLGELLKLLNLGEKPQKPGNTARPITTDDITRIIVRKIKQNKDNNEKIGQVLKTYGVERVSDLKPEQYEAFVTDLAAL